jgi:hypothetical protein
LESPKREAHIPPGMPIIPAHEVVMVGAWLHPVLCILHIACSSSTPAWGLCPSVEAAWRGWSAAAGPLSCLS